MTGTLQFSIACWHAAGSKMADAAAWQAWARHPQAVADWPEYQPALPFLPAMQRRRLGSAARLLFDAAWPLLDDAAHCPLVFTSHDGEINRSFALWLSLLRDNEVSPTSFGLSVHNALAGQWSLLRGDMSESTALCAAEDHFEMAVAEAVMLLDEGAESVLVVVADEPLQAQYDCAGVVRAPFAHALAMLLVPGDEWQLSFGPAAVRPAHGVVPYWGALHWLQAQYAAGRPAGFRQPYVGRQWQWRHADELV